MKPNRIRYQWFQDVPRNVTRREYQGFQFRVFCALGLGVMAVMMAIAGLTGLTLKSSRELAAIDSMTIAEAVDYQGDRLDLVKLEGFLVADDPLTMPDDEGRSVIRGVLTIIARSSAGSDTEDSEAMIRETLFDWNETATTVVLSDGETHISLAFDLATLPLLDESQDFSADVVKEGDSARTNRPVAVKYGDMFFQLSPATWGDVETVFTDLERQVLPNGQAAVVVASLVPTPTGNQLEAPLGDRLQVRLGTEQEIREQGQQTRVLFLVLCVPFGIASFLIGRSAHQLRQEFVERSHQ
jgi:hypothetical protein